MATYDPYAVVILVCRELARDRIKSRFEGSEIPDAVQAAEALLTALGVTPVVPEDDEDA